VVTWPYSINLAIPEAFRAMGNQLSALMEYGECFTVPLSPTGEEPVTHYGCHTIAKPEFVALIQHAMENLELPPQLVGVEIPQEVLEAFFANLAIEINANDGNPPMDRWLAFLAERGLQTIVPSEDV